MMRRESRIKKQEARIKKLNLLETQQLVASLVMRPLDSDDGMQRVWVDGRETAKVAAAVIAPNDRLSSFERIEIYNKQYWYRVRDCFGDDFPGLRGVLGDKKFDRLADAYLAACPSRSFSLRNLGQFLVGFLEGHPELTAPWTDLAMDMAKFEWAQVEAFDGPGHAPLSAEDLAEIARNPSQARLQLQPYVQLLELRYPLDDFLLALKKKNGAMRAEASNAVEEGVERRKLRGVRRPRAKRIWLVVHRYENSLYYKRVEREAFETLVGLREGKTVEAAVAGAIAGAKGQRDWSEVIRRWFDTWARLGWFYSPAVTKKNKKKGALS